MSGTLAGALEARHVPAFGGPLATTAEGDVEEVDGKLLLTRVRLRYRLKVPADGRGAAERALAPRDAHCPVSQSLQHGIRVEWSADVEEA